MRIGELIHEVAAATWAQKVSALMVAILVAAMCLTTLLTVGRSAAAEIQVQQRMESAGSRVITIHDNGEEELINPGTVAVIEALSLVESAVGLGTARDVTNGAVGPGGPTAHARTLIGHLPSAVALEAGRWPQPGEALISAHAQTTLGMEDPYGYILDGEVEYPVVGAFRPLPLVEELDGGIVIASPAGSAAYLTVLAADTTVVGAATTGALRTLSPVDTDAIRVESPQSLADVQQEVAGDLGAFSRTLLLGVLTAGAALVTVVVLADVLLRRADLGRRRALGATRTVIITLVVGRTILPSLLGAFLATAIGLGATHAMDARPPLDFAAGTATLALLAATLASLPPALYAANRDPVSVLRTP